MRSQSLKINGVFKHFREAVHARSPSEVICEVKRCTGVKRRTCLHVGGKCFRAFVTLCIKNRRGGSVSWRCVSTENRLKCVFFCEAAKVNLGPGGNKPISSNLISCKLEG